MILLNDLIVGHVLKTSGEIAFRCKGTIAPNYIPIIPIKQYFLINKEEYAQPISLAADFTSSQHANAKAQIKSIPVGTVAWTSNNFGLNQYILITKNVSGGVMMVASLGEPRIMNASARIVDLGKIEDYQGPNIAYDQLRVCPNCLNKALKAKPMVVNDVTILTGKCYNCKCIIKVDLVI